MISLVKRKLDDEIDELFRLPVAEFTAARNVLAARLKKEGRANEAERVKLLAKPSVSAWAVNQLYWDHREAFDQLIATGKRFRASPASRRAGKAGFSDSLDARREALVQLSDLATELLREAGHNPSQETIRRVTTTLEALSAYALLSDGPTPGRLTNDVDPPSFESLASLMSGGGFVALAPVKSGAAATKKPVIAEVRKLQQAKIAAAKVSLQDAKRSLAEARAKAQSLESAQKKANAEAKQAEQRLQKTIAASKEAAQELEDAKRSFEQATKELESLLRE
jgi:hypothetical protein